MNIFYFILIAIHTLIVNLHLNLKLILYNLNMEKIITDLKISAKYTDQTK